MRVIKKMVFLLMISIISIGFLACRPMTKMNISQPEIIQIPLIGKDVYPEGIAVHSKTREIFVSGSWKGEIQRISNSEAQYFKEPGEEGLVATGGMAINADTNELWVCNSDFGFSIHSINGDAIPKGEIRVYDIDTAQLKASFPLSSPGVH